MPKKRGKSVIHIVDSDEKSKDDLSIDDLEESRASPVGHFSRIRSEKKKKEKTSARTDEARRLKTASPVH